MPLLNLRSSRLVCVAIAAWLCGHGAAHAQVTNVEDEVKAVFLFNFSKYVSWPLTTFGAGPAAPIRICVAANAALVAAVTNAVAGEKIEGHPLETATPATLEEARACHILFVSKGETARMRPIILGLRTLPVLTIGEGTGLGADGNVIELIRDRDRVRFDVSRPAAAQKGLAISSKLLRVARRVVDQ